MIVGSRSFADLMAEHGTDTASSQAMFEDAIGWVVLGTVAIGAVVAIVVAVILGNRLARPLREISQAARAIADGDYGARIPRQGPEEFVSLADSFNQMAAALEEQERMRREFIANAAHELRTPLTNLQGYLEALRDGVIEPDPATFESLWEEAERLVRLSRSLDTLAAGDAGVPSALAEVDLAAIVRSAVELARPALIAAELTIEVDVPERLPARGDPDQLAQVVGNLLQNATRYTPPGGRVGLRAERRPDDVLVSVTNTGAGIPPDDLSARVRALLPGREVPRPGPRRRRDRARDRPPARRGGGRRGRRGVARRADALLVQRPACLIAAIAGVRSGGSSPNVSGSSGRVEPAGGAGPASARVSAASNK